MDKNKSALSAKTRLGIIVFVALIVLEVLEYVLGIAIKHGNWPIMAVLALIGAWPILWYFMHLHQLWHREEE
jgi:heme/copper-type cytochrome/quinol oxidase subunit 4